MNDTHSIQRRLSELGLYKGKIDGITGPLTKEAVLNFQTSNGLVVDGIVGPKTRLALFPGAVKALAGDAIMPRWLRYAIAEIGVKEVAGSASNPRILAYRALGRTTDDMRTEDGARPWCADFVNAMIEISDLSGTRSGMARSFENSEHFVRLSGPAIGSIMTFWRGSTRGGSGHVGFAAGLTAGGRMVLVGGNQKDAVTAATYGTERLTGYWWPASERLPRTGNIPAIILPTTQAGREA
jgi:uncharacterized protein (TIGR02594 family)